ncbi:IclR family transcriptional regulator [Halobellus marinus]|uniref:IclR family transcriptional regulator n=1 Tax=Halobellus TaxID=1073986 RepID=UPI0028A77CE0|nr:IclR family transcriptional regulator [Halobellus sp. DFY28]
MSPDDRVTTTETSFEIVDTIKNCNGATLSQLNQKLDLSRSGIHKHLHTLQESGFLTKEDNTYHIGMRFYNLGEYARKRKQEFVIIEKHAEKLSNNTNEEVDFLIENNNKALSIFRSHHPIENQRHSGRYYYMHSVAGGKALLSTYTRDRVEAVLNQWGLPKRTENTITSRAALFQELSQIRDQGYAISDEEFERGLRAIAIPVEEPLGEVIGALVISGPTYRMSHDRMQDELADTIQSSREELESVIYEEKFGNDSKST